MAKKTKKRPKAKKKAKRKTKARAPKKPRKKKTTKPQPPEPAPVETPLDEKALDQVATLLIRERTAGDVERLIAAIPEIGPDQAGAYLAAASGRLADERKIAIAQLKDLYKVSIDLFDTKTALACRKERSRIEGLYTTTDADPAGDEHEDELIEIRGHLVALDLVDDPDELDATPTAELARMASLAMLTNATQ